MAAFPYRAICVWAALLAAGWLALFSPWSTGWNVALAVLVALGTAWACVVLTRRAQVRKRLTRDVLGAVDAGLATLPADFRRNTPLVIVAGGDEKPSGPVSGADQVSITEAGIWVRLADPARLMYLADALKRWRGGQGPDALVWLIEPDEIMSMPALSAEARRWRAAIAETRRAIGYALPVCVALVARETHPAPDDCPWFGEAGTTALDVGNLASRMAEQLAQYVRAALPAQRARRAGRAARLDALTRWACEAVLPALTHAVREARSTVPPVVTAFGVTAVGGQPAAGSLYGQFMTRLTGLSFGAVPGAVQAGAARPVALPEMLVRGMAMQSVRSPLPRALACGFGCLAVAFCAASLASAWNNRALVSRIDADLARYRAIPATRDAARLDALGVLRRERDELERYASLGVPPRLGVGLYRGAPLRQQLQALIDGYRSPPSPPSTIELDSMSLFDSGKSVLKPGSTRALVSALEMIRAHPDKRVLVAGYTDSVGDSAANQVLSEARAAAVRDWLVEASGIPVTRFAIQGYGDTRPKASNDTEAGRAANRRVDITLVPDCRDDSGLTSGSNHSGNAPVLGQQACS